MPIRFACEHCFQMLSISSRKIGKRLHCPRCHDTLIVPDEAGAARSIALRKAAKAARAISPPPLPGQEAPPAAGGEVQTAGAALEMESLLGGSLEEPNAEYVVYDESDLVYDSERGQEVSFDPTKVAVPRAVIFFQGFLILLVAAAAFAMGLFFGGGPKRGDGGGANRRQTIRGTVTPRPETPVMVIALPDVGDRAIPPAAKLLGKNLFPEASPGNQAQGIADVRELGGDAQLLDRSGKFQLQLPAGGGYRVLAIWSAAAGKPDKAPAATELGHYFQDPKEILSGRRVLWTTATVNGDLELPLTGP